jgi:hypothetical protein
LGIDWVLKDEPLMTREEIEILYDIAKATGVRNVKWSGLTKKNEDINETA